MSTKFQVKPKCPIIPRKSNEDDEDIIEIEEIPSPNQVKASQKYKEKTENSSSESTTNKNAKNTKIDENELIEIMDVEIPDFSKPVKKKASAPAQGQKNNVNKIENENEKKRDKKLIKSVSKIGPKEKKRNAIGKKGEKITNITLNESDNENNENIIQSTTEVKIASQKGKNARTPDKKNKNSINKYPNRKNTSKTPNKRNTSNTQNKKIINKSKENADNHNRKNKNIEKLKNKKNEKNEKEDIIQCQLSEESEDGDNQKKNSKNKIQKVKKSNKKANTSKDKEKDNYNSGYLSSRKTSLKKQKNSNENENLKSKSTIKVNLKNGAMKEKINNLLGRKRKQPDNQIEKLKTSNKKSNKSETTIVKKYPKQKNKDEKIKSKTPFKNISKKNIQTYNSKMDIDDNKPKKKCATPELAVLNHLILEYGFEKVLDSLCKPKLDPKNKMDSCLQGLKDSCSNEKLPFLLVKMLFSYFQSKFNDKAKKPTKKRSTSVKKSNCIKNIIDNFDKSDSKLNNDTKSIFSMLDHVENVTPIQIEEDEKEKNKENEKKSEEKDKNKTVKKPIKEETKNEKKDKKVMSIGSHYQKTEGGEIYKYQVSVLDGKGNAIFKCYDDKCSGMAIYELDSRNFTETKKHNLKHSEHEYIMNYDKNGDVVFKDLIESEKSNAQVFKENGERTVKFY